MEPAPEPGLADSWLAGHQKRPGLRLDRGAEGDDRFAPARQCKVIRRGATRRGRGFAGDGPDSIHRGILSVPSSWKTRGDLRLIFTRFARRPRPERSPDAHSAIIGI